MEKIVRFSNNVFDRTILKKQEVIEMIENLVETVKIMCIEFSSNIAENYEILKLAIDFGILNIDEDFSDILENNNELKNQLIQSLQTILNEKLLDKREIYKFHHLTRLSLVENEKNSGKPTLIDLFSGAGGLSLGLSQSGMRIIFANDIEQSALRSYNFNHPEVDGNKITKGGIENIAYNISEFIDEDVDILAGGPPCQGFSMANRQRIIDDPRNVLYKYYVETIKNIKPKVFIMENVKPMLKVANQVIEDIKREVDIEYSIAVEVLNAKNLGVSQNRERLIFIGIRKDISEYNNINAWDIMNEIKNQFTEIIPLDFALTNLKPLQASRKKNSTEEGSERSGYKISNRYSCETNVYLENINRGLENRIVFNHKARYNNDRDIEIFGRMHQGDKSDSPRIADIMPYKSRNHIFKDKYYKLIGSEPCKTITAHMKFDCNMYIHPYQSRGLTPREAARVQSFPDNYFFLGAYTKTYQQIGNSVPPVMARKIGEIIIEKIFK